VLIIGTIVITNQMDYFQNKSLGFNKEAIISVPVPDNRNLNYETLRSRLIENTGINGVSFASSSISSPNRWLSPISFMDQGVKEEFNVDVKFADEQYLKTNELELLAGRNYLKADTIREVVVNEALIRKMGITDPQDAIGRHVSVWDRHEAPIVGVVKDFHLASFHEDIGPCLIATRANSYRVASIRLSPQRMNDALAHVEQVWASAFPDYLFDYEFLDQTIARYYAEEQKIAGLFNIFSGIAITISCLGLLGLISYITAQRTKEMGVRKVLGASTVQITLLYFKEFASLVLLAFLIAAPLAWFVMNEWLQNFRYAVEVGPGIFILAAGVSLAIAAITVGYQSVQAARSNPIKNLRID
jgi:putative ABC transport system permease protein